LSPLFLEEEIGKGGERASVGAHVPVVGAGKEKKRKKARENGRKRDGECKFPSLSFLGGGGGKGGGGRATRKREGISVLLLLSLCSSEGDKKGREKGNRKRGKKAARPSSAYHFPVDLSFGQGGGGGEKEGGNPEEEKKMRPPDLRNRRDLQKGGEGGKGASQGGGNSPTSTKQKDREEGRKKWEGKSKNFISDLLSSLEWWVGKRGES